MLNNLARQEQNSPVFHEVGFVKQIEKDHFVIAIDNASYTAGKAVSCLQYPELGDKVLLLMDREDCYILSVLEKKGNRSKIVFEGDTEFICKNGKIRLISQKGLDLMTTGSLNINTSNLQIAAEQGAVNIDRLTILGSYLLGKIAKIKIVGGSLESLFDRFRQKTKHSYREVRETDYLKAKQLDYNADSLMALHGKFSFITAEEDVKINGERIHMG